MLRHAFGILRFAVAVLTGFLGVLFMVLGGIGGLLEVLAAVQDITGGPIINSQFLFNPNYILANAVLAFVFLGCAERLARRSSENRRQPLG